MIGLLSTVREGSAGVSRMAAALRLLRRLWQQIPAVLSETVATCLAPFLDPAATEEGLDRALAAAEALEGMAFEPMEPMEPMEATLATLATKALARSLDTVLGCLSESKVVELVKCLEGLRVGGCGLVAWLAAQDMEALRLLLAALNASLPRRWDRSGLLVRAVCEGMASGPAANRKQRFRAVFKAAKSDVKAWASFFAACCDDPAAEQDAVCMVRLLSGGLFTLDQHNVHTQKRIVVVAEALTRPAGVLEALVDHADADCILPIARLLELLTTVPVLDGAPLLARPAAESLLVNAVPRFPVLLRSLLLLSSSCALAVPQCLLAHLPLLPTLSATARLDLYLLLHGLSFAVDATLLETLLEDALGEEDELAVAALALVTMMARNRDRTVFEVLQRDDARIAGMVGKWREMSKAVLEPTRANRLRVMR